MKKTIVFGPVHTDVIMNVASLPKGNEETETLSTYNEVSGGGYLAGRLFNELDFPFEVICDPGKGIYGDYARGEAEKAGIHLFDENEEIGGCVMKMRDPKGNEASFCVDGSERHFSFEQIYDADPDEYGLAAVFSGMIVSDGADELVQSLGDFEIPMVFVCSERVQEIELDVLDGLFALKPLTVISADDILSLTGQKTAQKAAQKLHEETDAPVIVLSKDGSYCYTLKETITLECNMNHTADEWAAAFIAAKAAGLDERNAMQFANHFNFENAKQALAALILNRKN